jgi:DNA-binding NarL/FixJ family response regulator
MLVEALERVLALDTSAPLTPIGRPVDGDEAIVAACEQHQPDVVLLDVDGSIPTATVDLVARMKSTAERSRLVLLLASRVDWELLLLDYVRAGADAFIDRSEPLERLLDGLQAITEGAVFLPDVEVVDVIRGAVAEPSSVRRVARVLRSITPRELEVLQLVGDGLGNEEIAARLHISVRTVASHVQNLFHKMEVHSRIEAVALANRVGLLSMEPSTPSD